MRRLPLALLATLAFASCYKETTEPLDGHGVPTTVELTDAPFPYDSVAHVVIYVVDIAVRDHPDTSNTGYGWITVAEPRRRFDLIELNGGLTDTLGSGVIPPGDYRAVRMVIDTDSSYVTSVTGQRMPVDWQSSAGRPALYALVEAPIGITPLGAEIVIDFDVGRSFLCEAPCHAFTFSPVLRAVNKYVTGAVSGVVQGDTLASYAAPIRNVTLTVYSGDPGRGIDEWWVRATARTDATGRFRIAYLYPGTYILRADAPRGSPFTAGVRTGVAVNAMTETTNLVITLPRGTGERIVISPTLPYAYVGDSVELSATLLDPAGYPIPGVGYTWTNLDTAIADLYPSFGYPNRALFRAKRVGTARFQVQADSASLTVTIPVYGTPVTGVDWVDLTPDSALLAVGDSLLFTAIARDSAGAALPNQTYTWSATDTTVIALRVLGGGTSQALVRGLKAGSATVRATAGGVTGMAAVRVP